MSDVRFDSSTSYSNSPPEIEASRPFLPGLCFPTKVATQPPDDGDDQMNEDDEDVVHAGIVSKSQKLPEFRPIL
jgi:hypothetical protein